MIIIIMYAHIKAFHIYDSGELTKTVGALNHKNTDYVMLLQARQIKKDYKYIPKNQGFKLEYSLLNLQMFPPFFPF